MGKLTNKGKPKCSRSFTHEYDIKTSNCEKTRVQMQDIGCAFEIKRPAT